MAVTGFEITLRRPLAGGAPFGDVGPYEELKGRLRYAIDPSHAANRGVTDVALAPRNAAGLVEFSADLSLLVPVDRARASGRALIDVVNRGNTVRRSQLQPRDAPGLHGRLRSEPADRRRRWIPDAPRLRRRLVAAGSSICPTCRA